MPSRDRRTADMHNGSWRGVVKKGTVPRAAPPKAWNSSKPPGVICRDRLRRPKRSLDGAPASSACNG